MMNSVAQAEAWGDWRNFKGDHYHLLYTVWLLLREDSARVAFYQGNDLLYVPGPLAVDQVAAPLNASAHRQDRDVWVQLKSTPVSWNRKSLIAQVLFNFLHNALTSHLAGRKWEVRLVTQGQIPQDGLEIFLSRFSDPKKFPDLKKELAAIVERATRVWNDEHEEDQKTSGEVQEVALEVIGQLSRQKPLYVEVMKAEIAEHLTTVLGNRVLTDRIAHTLIGNLLEHTAAVPGQGRVFDENWLEEAAGRPLKLRGLLDTDPLAACAAANANVLPRAWSEAYFTPRAALETALHEFLKAKESTFSLIGLSGTGKTWMGTWIASVLCRERPCLLISAGDLANYSNLAELVASRLSRLTMAQDAPEALLRRWHAASESVGDGTPVVILDDLTVPATDALQLRQQVGRLARQAKQEGVKLILTCQAQIWRVARLGESLDASDVFPLFKPQDDYLLVPLEDDSIVSLEEVPAEPQAIRAEKKIQQRSSLQVERVSFVLEDFTADELEDAARRRLGSFPEERACAVANQLRSPAFSALRNPFLLTLYLDRNGDRLRQFGQAPPLDIDELLDERVSRALDTVALQLNCHVDDLREAFGVLVSHLWQSRDRGLTHNVAAKVLGENSGLAGNEFVLQLRITALLAPEPPIRLERTPVAERLFALELEKREAAGFNFLVELRPEEDAGVVAAYLRHLAASPLPLSIVGQSTSQHEARDAVAFAERLLHSDARWVRAVCNGLAQASPDDVRVVAFLAALTRPLEEGALRHEACRALGQLAARGGEAMRWVAEMYLGDSSEDRLRGAVALSELLEFDPQRVGRLVAKRLERAAQIDCFAFKAKERRDRSLRWALDPLTYPRHAQAASISRGITAAYADLVEQCGPKEYVAPDGGLKRRTMFDHHFDWKLAEDLAEVRGGQLIWDRAELEAFLQDLTSADRKTRLLASASMRPAAFVNLEIVAEPLLRRLAEETDSVILSRLLWASYGLGRPSYAARLLEAFRIGKVKGWDDHLICGPALVMMARLAPRDPLAVLDMLPRKLDRLQPAAALFLHQALVYAWWSLAQQSHLLPIVRRQEAWEHLVGLTDLPPVPTLAELQNQEREQEKNNKTSPNSLMSASDDSSVTAEGGDAHEIYQSRLTEKDGWPFQAMGAALARLALMGRDRIAPAESQMHEVGHWRPYYFADIEDLCSKHTTFLTSHADVSLLQESLLVCVRAQMFAPFTHPVDQDADQHAFSNAAFQTARASLGALALLLRNAADPLPTITQVPRTALGDWQQIFLVTRLLELGRRDEALLALARELCEHLRNQQTANGAAERTRCLAQMAVIKGEGQDSTSVSAALEEHREQTLDTFWGSDGVAQGFARLTDGHPERLIQALDDSIKDSRDLLPLYLWEEETRDWRGLLLARVFRRMFSTRPISPAEARRLCRHVLAALQSLPESPLRQQWWVAYTTIYSVLTTRITPGGSLDGRKTPIQNSHLQAMWLLNEAVEHPGVNAEWFSYRVEPNHTLFVANTFAVKDGELSYSPFGGAHTLWVFPAVRLAAIALDGGRFLIDPVGKRMQQRESLHAYWEEFSNFFHFYRHGQRISQKLKDGAVKRIEKLLQDESTSLLRDDLLRQEHLNILLMADYPERAKEYALLYLDEAENRLLTTKETLYSFWYCLACAHARLEETDSCRRALEKAIEYGHLDSKHISEDRDLESVRQENWFRDLIGRFAVEKPDGTRRFQLSPPAVITHVEVDGDRYTAKISLGESRLEDITDKGK